MSINRGMDKHVVHTHTLEYYSATKKNEIMPLAATWMDPETIIISEVNKSVKQRRRNILGHPLYVESKKK